MKRSEINEIIRKGNEFITSFGYVMPPFAYWSAEDMRKHNSVENNILNNGLGWDITDYGQSKFDKLGLFLFTVRNGTLDNLKHGRGMVYAEKIMISRKNQVSPMHRHIVKTEDIINRGGGVVVLELFTSDGDGNIDAEAAVEVYCDGMLRKLSAGEHLKLMPGESVTLEPNIWHAFWGEGADVLIGEISTVNDDKTDNIFRDPFGRFPTIDEDEAPLHLLVSDY